jgi:hypothetical protein
MVLKFKFDHLYSLYVLLKLAIILLSFITKNTRGIMKFFALQWHFLYGNDNNLNKIQRTK